jgi:hypothetical protein
MPKSKPSTGKSTKTTAKAVKKSTKRINPKVAEPYDTKYAEIAMRLAASNATEMDIAWLLGTNTTNLRKWKAENPDFAKCLNRGAQFTLAKLIGSGIHQSVGYDYVETKKKYVTDKNGNLTGDIEVTETPKKVHGNPSLLMFLIGCLDRRLGGTDWQSKQFIESKSEKNVNIRVIDGKKIAEQIDKLGGKWSKAIECEFVEKEPEQITGKVDSES